MAKTLILSPRFTPDSMALRNADDKCFPARVYARGSELPEIESLSAWSPVLVSDPVSWESEFRCFALEKRVAAMSIYSRNGDLVETEDGNGPASPSESKDALHFANLVLQDARVTFPPAGVVDVGVIKGRGWAVVEANACWGAGIYGCDPPLRATDSRKSLFEDAAEPDFGAGMTGSFSDGLRKCFYSAVTRVKHNEDGLL